MTSRQGAPGELEQAYVLHSRDYRDTSLIADLFGRSTGRFSVVLKGARSERSKVRGRVQPFTPLLVGFLGRGELKTATQIDFTGRGFRLSGDNLLLGLYINELLYRLLGRYDPVTQLFDIYEALLTDLESGDDPVLAVRQFELQLLVELGYGINFEYDARDGAPILAEAGYRFVVSEGFQQVTEEGSSEMIFPGSELLSIATGEWQSVDEKRLRFLARKSLASLLGGKPLKSRSLFRGAAR